MTERITKHGAAEILGITPRVVVYMAGRGELPSAAKIGKGWTFDKGALRAYVRKQEIAGRNEEKPRAAVSGAARRSTVAPRLTVLNASGLYRQTIQKWRKAVATTTSKS